MISVILPVLNGANTIKSSIESVCNQTYTDFELLIIDNGSTDRTIEICRKYEKQDKRIKFLRCEETGVVAARKLGILEARGEYIAFIDADDAYVPTMLYKMEQAARINHADIVSCGYISEYPNGSEEFCFPVTEGIVSTDKFFDCLFESGTLGFLWNKLYRKDVLNQCEHPKNMEVCEDTFINCSIMRSERKIVVLNECLYQYYVNRFSVTHTLAMKIDSEDNWKYLTSYRKIRNLFKNDPRKAYRVRVSEWWIIKLGVEELHKAGKQGKKAKKKLLIEMKKSLKDVLCSNLSFKFKISYFKCYISKKGGG